VCGPTSRGLVRLYDDVLGGCANDALSGLDGYSHAILLWHFHDNRQARALAKIAPPRLGGDQRVGVFASRSPHRPTPIGLSVVRVEGLDTNVLLVSGADLIDGTPVLDIKPYVPYADAFPDAVVPSWLSEAVDTAPLVISFSDAAEQSLEQHAGSLRFCSSTAAAKTAICEVLRSELRSAYRRADEVQEPFAFYFDCLDVHVAFDDATRSAVVTAVRYFPWGSGEPPKADADVFRSLLSDAGLPAHVNDARTALVRVSGVLLHVPVPSASPGDNCFIRLDWRSGELAVRLHSPTTSVAASLSVDLLVNSTERGWKAQRCLGLAMRKGPVPSGWLRKGQRLGVDALYDALLARPDLTAADFMGRQS
jgi:tRNA-Thr(GGU) m(6)t(6)A37 methyltransferase TsaA